ncbi:urea carboxylase [Candidatus Pantoea varia]|uniref:Biotin carboxylase n=1 Tax=Candidatus Pantoea varia TaxID=1881036 RepID=A0A1I5F3B6_9GAMM|nr:urea carboxylase [Pantoea varia]SFO18255.1 urea carboxylase [Pantoea varia]
MFDTLLIANRGAIACRILRTLRTMQVKGVAVYSEADLSSLHIREADVALSLGEGPAAQTYLVTEKIIAAAQQSGAKAIHPGYGFLSENAAFAESCEAAGLIFVGPTPQQLRTFGLKHTARALAKAEGVPLLEGSELLADVSEARRAAESVGYPVMLKSTAGGGGIGMRVCRDVQELSDAFETVQRLGQNNFSDAGVFLEKYIERARHLEVQIFGDGRGEVIALGVRDCSIQRRNQKVIEETPAPNLPAGMADALCSAAIALGKAVNYRSAGTVEFVYDSAQQQFYFLEVNTRLQVEHGVTEQVWGVDLVQWMIELAAGDLPSLTALAATLNPQGHAVQARIYAEDPGRQFQPSPGLLTEVHFPAADGNTLRIDRWVEAGCEVPPFFDPMLAKAIAFSATRDEAIATLAQALAETRLYGVETNRLFLLQILAFAPFTAGEPWTRCLEQLGYQAATVEVLSAGTQTSVQDYPGRLGYWAVGVPPSGPMDDRALRFGNRLLGNAEGTAALEITLNGPTLKFNTGIQAVICGAPLRVTLDGAEQAMDSVFTIPPGSTLKLGAMNGPGVRSYLCLSGGIQVPDYLGSKSTFTLGQFGGHAGRALRSGDVLHLDPQAASAVGTELPAGLRTDLARVRTLRVIYGPHGAPEFFAPDYIATFFATEWEVHFNSSRTGVRLIGPKPIWTRDSGGEAGLHPSNIHDNPYAIGAVDFTGDMPVILGPDGPSLGGFVCPVTVIEADLWQLGQLKAGDKIQFVAVDIPTARRLAEGRRSELTTLQPHDIHWKPAPLTSPIVMTCGEAAKRLVARLSGDTHLLMEAGEPELDLVLRFRIHALMQALETQSRNGIIDITPGIRSLQIHFQPEIVTLDVLLAWVRGEWETVCMSDDLQVPTRVVHLPLSWDDPACQKAIEKYMTTVRPDAPWCPSNLEFIRRINDLPDEQAVWNTVFEASYLVMGLGDVYLGAPVATPLDPRHRLVTTKYNPARTWTAENSVGIGGAYLCVYGMEGPGGYQFVGRTLQMWNRYHEVADFGGKPWLLRFFDQIRFYPVSADELLQIRRDFPLGRYPLRIEHSTLRLAEYQEFLVREAESIGEFRNHQQSAFNAERDRWIASGQAHFDSQESAVNEGGDPPLQPGEQGVESPVSGNLWQVQATAGSRVREGDILVVLESMKMEIPLLAPCDGIIQQVSVQPGSAVRAGQRVAVIVEDNTRG